MTNYFCVYIEDADNPGLGTWVGSRPVIGQDDRGYLVEVDGREVPGEEWAALVANGHPRLATFISEF